jgi:hypothetical protein
VIAASRLKKRILEPRPLTWRGATRPRPDRRRYRRRRRPPHRNRPPAPGFHPLPIQTEYFERMIIALETAGVSIDFIMMPTARTRAPSLGTADLERDFIRYLREVERRHPKFHLSQSAIPIWPDRNFVDEAHLNPDAAAAFTTLLKDCLRLTDADWKSGTYSRSCEFASVPMPIGVDRSDIR